MPLDNPRDMFLYEIGARRDAERSAELLQDLLIDRVPGSRLEPVLRRQAEEIQRHLENIDGCLGTLGVSLTETGSTGVEGLRSSFEHFLRLQPTAELRELFAALTAIRVLHLAIASYRVLVDQAMLIGEQQCAQVMLTNLIQKEQSVADLVRLNHDLGQHVLVPA
ncbi:DUF892 family protein [Micromonospora sp. NPDC049559]|uniref:DUF892 family protein n=1 Tax=Micromonospora sp. NPDC049559 TaxID=3155923 RepID=UPI0034154CD7